MYNKDGKPTTFGINKYVEENKYEIIKEFEQFVKDTFFLDIEIKTDNLEEYTGNTSADLGYHYTYTNGTDEIIIDNRERYSAYDINDLSKLKKINLKTNNSFVKTVVIHELGHSYFLQNTILCIFDSITIYNEYDFRTRLKIYPNSEITYGAQFIEEGICQYIVQEMHLQLPEKPIKPESISDLKNNDINDFFKYGYSITFLQDFINENGLQNSIMILLQNKPPTYEEILKPNLFFNRLN